MDAQLTQVLIDEIRENRKAIKKLDKRVGSFEISVSNKMSIMDQHIFSNKLKLSLFIGGLTLFFSCIWVIIAEKVKTLLI